MSTLSGLARSDWHFGHVSGNRYNVCQPPVFSFQMEIVVYWSENQCLVENRKHRATIRQSTSNWKNALSGVPEDRVLDSVLFECHIY